MTSVRSPHHSEHRQGALSNCTGGQPPSIWNSGRQQADAGDNDKFPILPRGKGKAEHAAQILDADHFRAEYIRYANRVDDFGTHTFPFRLWSNEEECICSCALARGHNQKNESKQSFSVYATRFSPVISEAFQ
jgi:hypothetical protein